MKKVFRRFWVGYAKNNHFIKSVWVEENAVEQFKQEMKNQYKKEIQFVENMRPIKEGEAGTIFGYDKNGYGTFNLGL